MRAAIRCGLLMVALAPAAPLRARAESTNEKWEAAIAQTQSLVEARAKDVRDLRKETDKFVEQLNQLVRSKVVNLKPEVKLQIAQKRLYYYTRLGAYNAAVVDLERALDDRKIPKNVSPVAQQKLRDTLARLHDELRAMVVSLNHVARSVKDL